jgi:6-phosphofructokinase 1
MKLGILTGGGDCPGLNAVIRAVAKKAMHEHKAELYGIEDAFEGLVEGRWRQLSWNDVSGILTRGGTILGTTNRSNPFKYGEKGDRSELAIANYQKLGLDALIALGGDGTQHIGYGLSKMGARVVGVPKTIDNDVIGTEITFGFDTAVTVAANAVTDLHSTADAHRRIMVVEVMGRDAGWIALHAGVAGGADVILMPEIPYDMAKLTAAVIERYRTRRFTIVVVAEGASAKGSVQERKVGISGRIAQTLEQETGHEARTVILGHLQRAGTPTANDRLLATRLGSAAVDLCASGRVNRMVAVRDGKITSIPLEEVAGGTKRVPMDNDILLAARSMGVIFGD